MDARSEGSGAPLPASPAARWHEVVRPTADRPIHAVLVNDYMVGVWSHWDQVQGQTTLCTNDRVRCPGCRQGMGHRWLGFAAAWVREAQDYRVLGISERAARHLQAIMQTGERLRGMLVRLTRERGKPNGRVLLERIDRVEHPERLPEHFPLAPSLARVFCVPTIKPYLKAFEVMGPADFAGGTDAEQLPEGDANRPPWNVEGV